MRSRFSSTGSPRQRTDRHLAFLAGVSRALSVSDEWRATLEALAELAVSGFADWAMVDVADGETARRVAVAVADPAQQPLACELRGFLGPSLLQLGRPGFLAPVSDEDLAALGGEGLVSALRELQPCSLITVPLRSAQGLLGSFSFLRTGRQHPFGAEEVTLAEELAGRASLALENGRLREAARISAERAERLHGIATGLSASLSASDAAAVILHHALASLGAPCGSVAVVTGPGESELEVIGEVGHPGGLPLKWRRFPLSAPSPLSEAVLRRALVTSAGGGPDCPVVPQGEGWVALPFFAEGRVVGALGLGLPPSRALDGNDRAFLLALADQCGQALARARLYEAEILARTRAEEAQRRLAFLLQATTELAGSLDYAETLSRTARLAVPTLADVCTVTVIATRQEVERMAVCAAEERTDRVLRRMADRYRLREDGPLLQVVRSGEALLAQEITEELLGRMAVDPVHLEQLRAIGGRSLMIVPLTVAGERLGAVTFVSTSARRRYGDEDLALASDLARRAGLAVVQARMFEGAQAAARAKDEFLSVASHELRTPVAALQLQVQSLLHTLRRNGAASAPRMEAQLESAHRQVRRLGGLVGALLDVSSIAAGRLELAREPMDLVDMAREVSGRFTEDFQLARCPFLLDAAGRVTGDWDRQRLDLVLSSLLSNAIKYGRGRQVTLSITERDGTASLTVRDEGIGVPEEDLERIFGRFERAVPDRHYGGLGLGLWLSQEIVRGLGGDIVVDSRLGEGAAFTVRLPGARAEEADGEPSREVRAGSAA